MNNDENVLLVKSRRQGKKWRGMFVHKNNSHRLYKMHLRKRKNENIQTILYLQKYELDFNFERKKSNQCHDLTPKS